MRWGGMCDTTRAVAPLPPLARPMPRDIPIRGDTIRLGQLLKLAGIADSGGEARALVERGVVRVNGEVETRRGRQLHPGDEIAAEGNSVRVV